MTPSPFISVASAGDSLGLRIQQHLDLAFRGILQGEGVARRAASIRLVTGAPHPFGNLVVFSEATDKAAVQGEIDALCLPAAPSAVLFARAVPDAVATYLVSKGFQSHGAMPAMGVDIEHLAPTPVPPGCELVRIGAGAEGGVWEEVFAEGYGLPRSVAAYFAPNHCGATTGRADALQFFLVRCEGRPVATSALYLGDGLAGVYCVATLPQERNKGFGAFATAEPLRRVHELGYRVGVLQSSEQGHKVYERIGFRDCGGVPMYLRMPSSS